MPALRPVASAGREREQLREGYREKEGGKKLPDLKLPVLVGAIVVEDERIRRRCCRRGGDPVAALSERSGSSGGKELLRRRPCQGGGSHARRHRTRGRSSRP